MERRKFIQDSCRACLLLGSGFIISELAACGPITQILRLPISDDTIHVPISELSGHSLQIIRPEGWVYDIALRKTENGQFEALLLQCTHQKNQVIPEGNGFICPLHGSRYTLDGQVKKGPAELSLRKFPVRKEAGDLIIELKS
jgi:Rieske Fe-S protein